VIGENGKVLIVGLFFCLKTYAQKGHFNSHYSLITEFFISVQFVHINLKSHFKPCSIPTKISSVSIATRSKKKELSSAFHQLATFLICLPSKKGSSPIIGKGHC